MSTKGGKRKSAAYSKCMPIRGKRLRRCGRTFVAVVGLKNTTTGDSLCDPKAPLLLESLDIPVPVISIAIEPKSKADLDKLGLSLQRIAAEDPSSRSTPRKTPARPSSPGWGSCTWKF